eukprot:CAMPEP_0177361308 /NCGR_PEP_ID=MMETSP0368-20130122/37113_1 /TAXON_ID=447022 ORGANISM="Scrippsiella hangoei-like, Strain SHHI-4" /NCGR_SAMPLE_ID=MMETSP0368 /ASSEMBLY_ACC=CAM_ASM_000363 /LENGTH=48 /DNA_ID= /DNA_START= /DNA_END= /DNA_ORIENTATION=
MYAFFILLLVVDLSTPPNGASFGLPAGHAQLNGAVGTTNVFWLSDHMP